MTEKYIERFY